MLETLDRIPWAKLTHAYGKGADLPGHLRTLVSTDKKKRAKALFQIGASICHQGSMYSATAPATNVLVALVGAPKTPDRAAILKLLGDIATLDDDGPFLLHGMPASPKLPKAWKEGLAAVRAGVRTYVALLGDKDAEVRARAAYVLAWIPSRETAPALAKALATEKDAAVRATLVLALSYADPKATRTFLKLLTDKDATVRVAAAIANANSTRGKPTAEAVAALAGAAKKKLVVKSMGFTGGNLGAFATQVLAALPPSDVTNEALLAAIPAGGIAAFAANVLARRLFTGKKPKAPAKAKAAPAKGTRRDVRQAAALAAIGTPFSELAAPQQAFLTAVRKNEEAFDGDLGTFLGERGLPTDPKMLAAWMDDAPASSSSILDRVVSVGGKSCTLADAVVGVIKLKDEARAARVAEIVAAVPPSDLVDLAMKTIFDIDVSWSSSVALELLWLGAPRCKKEIEEEAKKLQKSGVPKRKDGENVYLFPMCLVAIGVGRAKIALAEKKDPPPWVDAFLQEVYGVEWTVREALAALPVARREKWVLDAERDDQEQPAEGFKGAWPYFVSVPTTKVTDRALKHVKGWEKKDVWGGSRKKYADPLLAEFAKALRDAGNTADAARCEAALAALP